MTTNNDDTDNTLNYGESAAIKTAQTNSDDINVANNVVNANSQDLIEGAYYYTENGIEKAHYCEVNGVRELVTPKGEVLYPVPPYDKWQEFTDSFKRLRRVLTRMEESNIERVKYLGQENKKLKELLKEWIKFYPIILYEHEDTLKTKDIIELFDKTREVLK